MRTLPLSEPIVVTGIGMITSVGRNREATWHAVRHGQSRFRWVRGLRFFPDNLLFGATVDVDEPAHGQMKVMSLCEIAAREAVADAAIDFSEIDRNRFGCSLAGHMGDITCYAEQFGLVSPNEYEWWNQFLPNTACSFVAGKFGLLGPRFSHSTACATSLISFITAVRSIRDGQCDIALAGGGDAIDPLFAAGFRSMKALATGDDPQSACRPFDRNRTGFVLGEGAAVMIVERLRHALARGARIYAEVAASSLLAEAHHVTGLDAESDALAHLIRITLRKSRLSPRDIGYINAHGTGTEQNDRVEMRAIRRVLGDEAEGACVSATKSILGHMINGAGAGELAITLLAMRDGYVPPTLNLTDPDPECTFDCVPLRGRTSRFQHALKLSVAFGGHLAAVALRRWNDPTSGFAYPQVRKAA